MRQPRPAENTSRGVSRSVLCDDVDAQRRVHTSPAEPFARQRSDDLDRAIRLGAPAGLQPQAPVAGSSTPHGESSSRHLVRRGRSHWPPPPSHTGSVHQEDEFEHIDSCRRLQLQRRIDHNAAHTPSSMTVWLGRSLCALPTAPTAEAARSSHSSVSAFERFAGRHRRASQTTSPSAPRPRSAPAGASASTLTITIGFLAAIAGQRHRRSQPPDHSVASMTTSTRSSARRRDRDQEIACGRSGERPSRRSRHWPGTFEMAIADQGHVKAFDHWHLRQQHAARVAAPIGPTRAGFPAGRRARRAGLTIHLSPPLSCAHQHKPRPSSADRHNRA